jgi:hypothetical protein
MTAVLSRPVAAAPATSRRWAGFLPPAALVAVMASALRHFEVPVPSSAIFLVYVASGVTLPGTLLWRRMRGSGPLVEDLACGTAVGYVVELLVYCLCRHLGAPLLAPLWAVAVVALFVAVPSWRGCWRSATVRPPVWWSWALTGCVAFLFGWSCLAYFRSSGIGSPGYEHTDFDMLFHLALVGELKHHAPAAVPWLSGEPLYYHWFVYAEQAATSWATGIEPQLLLYRLSPLPVLAATAVLIAALARRLTGTWWSGPIAVGITYLGLAPDPYGFAMLRYFTVYGFGVVEDGSLLRPTMWISPTQTFGTLIALALALVLVELLVAAYPGKGLWGLFTLLVVGVMGAKATYLPLFLCGLSLVVVLNRSARVRALGAGAVVLAGLLFAQFVLYGGASQGMSLRPLMSLRVLGVTRTTDLLPLSGGSAVRLAAVAALCLVCWAMVWSGSAGLLARGRWREPPHLLLAGTGLAGLGGVVVFWHPGLSQFFFLESARPLLGVLAAAGLSACARRPSRRLVAVAVAAVAGGAAVVWSVRLIDGSAVPHRTLPLLWPYAVLLAVAACLVRTPRLVLLALVAGYCLPSTVDAVRAQALTHPSAYLRSVEAIGGVPDGAKEAGRWLRDHSSPRDLVATNVHCVPDPGAPCPGKHFSVAAFTERRVLLEGWAYTVTDTEKAARTGLDPSAIPFWDPVLLAANDDAFARPSTATVGRLARQYHVRWLFADYRYGKPSAALGSYAVPRFRAGACAVFELTG